MHHTRLERMSDLVRATAQHDLLTAQRLAAVAVVEEMRTGGATARLGDYAGFTSAEVRGTDGRWMVITPLFDWDSTDEPTPDGCEKPGIWEYAVRDVNGTLLARPDGDDAFGCPSIWHRADHGLDLGEGVHDQHLMQDLMGSMLGWCLALGEEERFRRVVPGEAASGYATAPYPGERPGGSFVIDIDGRCWPVWPDESRPSGWRVEGKDDESCLDAWLFKRGAKPLSGRVPLLGYGSNACPGKVLANGTPLPSVHLAATMSGLASAWCTGTTQAGHTPVTVVAARGHAEEAVVMMVDGPEFRALDRVEGRNAGVYDLVLLTQGRVVLANGAHVRHPAAYVGASEQRAPVLVAGRPLLRADVDLTEASVLRSVLPATAGDRQPLGRVLPPGVHPQPGDCVPDLFVYGTLKPGQPRWPVLAPHVAAEPEHSTVRGELRDTGFGYPALNASSARKSPGVLCQLLPHEAVTLLDSLDEIEGLASGLYSRQLRLVEGRAAWVYVARSLAGVGVMVESW